MASIISAGTTSGTSLNLSGDTSGVLQLASNGSTTAVTINTSQNVGIGTASPATRLDVRCVSDVTQDIAYFSRPDAAVRAKIALDGSGIINFGTSTNHPLAFLTNNTECMRLTSGGNAIINSGYLGFTTQNGVATPTANGQGSIGTYNVYGTTITGQGSAYDISFFNKNQGVAGYVATGATTITTSSDERLKENLAPITNALATVNNLRTVTGNYKADPSRNVAFFVAQDMKEHFPQAFEDANPDAFGVNYNWTIPLLAAAIKELKAELDATKAEVQALKGTL
jgi:hypothetical protein